MKNPFIYSSDNKRYHTLNYYNKKVYGRKIFKAVLECGFSCPNIDGSKGRGGCIFCDGGSGYFTSPNLTITQQIGSERKRIAAKNGDNVPVIAYFQANTNTYASIDVLEKCYMEALDFPDVIGISIGTRADCLSDDVISLLCRINERTNLTVELGMQTMHDSTISFINRCCTHKEFTEGFFRLKEKGIRTCLHIINGLPNESLEMMLETALEAVRLEPSAVKLQMLHVIRGTSLEKMYNNGEFGLLSKEQYIDIIVRQLELLPPEIVIERITGDGDKSKLVAPKWSADKISVLGGIDKRLAELDTWQGKLYNK
ncbi:MAG: TIGR01212 family radical SAM protein [Ruminococcus flavefaciens]|nr:TIGR01212 family radical SAM protein [Ruminococcus flavefaciens]MCM1361712.1 TIGR01212 family radical SAM protein [Clostridiales bacterium]MCM1435507.1 TIGR01212 family radical SAM protein [Ruminococcus flavefaciens]